MSVNLQIEIETGSDNKHIYVVFSYVIGQKINVEFMTDISVLRLPESKKVTCL